MYMYLDRRQTKIVSMAQSPSIYRQLVGQGIAFVIIIIVVVMDTIITKSGDLGT